MLLCLLTTTARSLSNNKINFAGGYASAEWDYTQAPVNQNGIFGWSYYMRAFNLLKETPTQEIGWGQWSKPASPPASKPLEVCGMHPGGYLCEETPTITSDCFTTEPGLTKCTADNEECQCLNNCGATDYATRRNCKVRDTQYLLVVFWLSYWCGIFVCSLVFSSVSPLILPLLISLPFSSVSPLILPLLISLPFSFFVYYIK